MPAVTTVAFDSLLHRDAGHSSSAPISQHLTLHPRRDERPQAPPPRRSSSSSFSYYISSPALYVAPEPAQLAGSSSAMCISPSPYVVNHKRREWPPVAPAPTAPPPDCSDGDVQAAGREVEMGRTGGADDAKAEGDNGALGPDSCNGIELDVNGGEDGRADEGEPGEEEEEEVDDDFFNPKGPADSHSDTEQGASFTLQPVHAPSTPLLNQSEFYDASEDFFSDSSSAQPPRLLEMESELRSLRFKLFVEIERRKKAEDSLALMKNEWRKMTFCFSRVGISFPPIPDGQYTNTEDPVSEVCQEVVISRLVSEAIERDLARAEAEASAEAVIELKNHEISRLCDRLQYYEAVNREMSQRNQEEKARQRSQKRRSRQRLVWGCIGVSITIGACLLAHSYLSSPCTGSESLEPVNSTSEPSPAASEPPAA